MTYPGEDLYPGVDVFPDGPGSSGFHFGTSTYFGTSTWFGEVPEPLGAAFLLDSLGPSGRLIVEAAFGADLTVDAGTWTWTDLSHDVRAERGVMCSLGRGDEAATSQPAKLALTLDNRDGRYARGPVSDFWPYVRRNTPVRVRVNLGQAGPGGEPTIYLLWQGFADSWSPDWDVTGTDATVQLSASGVLRRLKQGAAPAVSVLRRTLPKRSDLLAYWPGEDDVQATSIASGIPGGTPMAVAGIPAYAQADDKLFVASSKLALLADSTWVGNVPAYTGTKTQVRFVLNAEDEGTYPNLLGKLVTVHMTGGTVATVRVYYYTDGEGGLLLSAFAPGVSSSLFTGTPFGAVKERPQVVSLDLEQTDAATWTWTLSYLYPGSSVYVYRTGTQAGVLGHAARVVVGDRASGAMGLVSIGHLTVRSVYDPDSGYTAYGGYTGEYADDRIRRLCAEVGMPIEIIGTSLQRMGPQTAADVLTLLREAEAVDGGILHDGAGSGLRYVCRTVREARTPDLVLDVAQGQVAKSLGLVDDDAGQVNSATIKRKGGSTVKVTDFDGPLGTATIGLYEDSATLAVDSDTRIFDHAGWAVHAGTRDDYRLPQLLLDLAAHPELAVDWVNVGPSSRIDLTNVNGTRTQLDDDTIGLLVEGWKIQCDAMTWKVTANTSAASTYRVGRFAPNIMGVRVAANEDELRAEGEGSYLASAADVAATSLSVATPTGPLWTTTVTDFPMVLDVGGRRVVATACTGTSSPQTFTVAALAARVAPGATVGLWRSPVLGL